MDGYKSAAGQSKTGDSAALRTEGDDECFDILPGKKSRG
jgi:hypothetical protein